MRLNRRTKRKISLKRKATKKVSAINFKRVGKQTLNRFHLLPPFLPYLLETCGPMYERASPVDQNVETVSDSDPIPRAKRLSLKKTKHGAKSAAFWTWFSLFCMWLDCFVLFVVLKIAFGFLVQLLCGRSLSIRDHLWH